MNLLDKLPTISRLALGGAFVLFGLNGFLGFLPQPPMAPEAGAFVSGLAGAAYFFPLLKSIETAAGLLLLANRFVPLALAVLAPVLVNVVAFHLFLSPASLPLVLGLLLLEIFLAWSYRGAFRAMLAARAVPQRQRLAEDGVEGARLGVVAK